VIPKGKLYGNAYTQIHRISKTGVMIRLFIIEDHPIIICGFKNIFRQSRHGIEISGSASNVKDAELKAKPEIFDFFILGLWIGNDKPEENVAHLKIKFPGKPIIIFTIEESGFWQKKMFSLGVTGYIFKSSAPDEIMRAIINVSHGGITFPGVTASGDIDKLDSEFILGHKSITKNQRQLVHMVHMGLKQKDIAKQKKVSISTIEKTLLNLREKFSAQNNTDLIRILINKGLF
jgi:two-component system, NarL family, invasion response regulator UvrY